MVVDSQPRAAKLAGPWRRRRSRRKHESYLIVGKGWFRDPFENGWPMDRYPLIADHGLVGDLQTSALVSSRGVVDWFAAPRFDSPSIFAALLDHDGGGYFRLAAEHPEGKWKQLYYPDTAVLVTRFMSPDGVGEVIDWMPPDRTRTPTDRHTLVRAVRAVRGTVQFALECRPRGPATDLTFGPRVPRSGPPGSPRTCRAPSPWSGTDGTSAARSP